MKHHTLPLAYYAYGDRSSLHHQQQQQQQQQPYHNNVHNHYTYETSCAKANALNIIERNYLSLQKPLNTYVDKPEYKCMKTLNQLNKPLNNYLTPLKQFHFNEPILAKTKEGSADAAYHQDIGSYSLRKAKDYVALATDGNVASHSHLSKSMNFPIRNNTVNDNGKSPIVLKALINMNILKQNELHVPGGVKGQRKVSPPSLHPNMEEIKGGSYLESRASPEYLRMYDKEKLKDIEDHLVKRGENVNVLSRFGNWITLRPGEKDRRKALEKVKHGTYETSIVAPRWMNLEMKEKVDKNKMKEDKERFVTCQWRNTCKANEKVTALVERERKMALPSYLCDSYERYAIEESEK